MLNVYEVITKQNYFINNENIKIQEDGLAMGAPSSSVMDGRGGREFGLQQRISTFNINIYILQTNKK